MNWFKKQFFSNKKPAKRIIATSVLVVLIISTSLVLRSAFTDKDSMFALVLSKVLVNFTNEDRKIKNLGELTVNPLLEKAAEMKAKDMISKGYFAHQSPEGHSPWYWLDQVGYDFSYAGENLAINFSESSDVNQAWLDSPKHKENIMNGNFTEIGIAVVDGMYQGKMTTFVVQFFGRPVKKVVAVKETKVTSPVVKKAIPAVLPEKKISTVALSTVLGESDQKIIYIGVEKGTEILNDLSKKTFWSYFIPVWF